jgi:hypothetical protein
MSGWPRYRSDPQWRCRRPITFSDALRQLHVRLCRGALARVVSRARVGCNPRVRSLYSSFLTRRTLEDREEPRSIAVPLPTHDRRLLTNRPVSGRLAGPLRNFHRLRRRSRRSSSWPFAVLRLSPCRRILGLSPTQEANGETPGRRTSTAFSTLNRSRHWGRAADWRGKQPTHHFQRHGPLDKKTWIPTGACARARPGDQYDGKARIVGITRGLGRRVDIVATW